ncbi:MAG: GNAT family N-acetyltransferase [Candidatus Thiodiazotropha sp.]
MKLRDIEERDIETIPLLLNNENVARYLTGRIPFPYTLDDAKWWVSTGHKEGINKAIDIEGSFAGMIGVSQGNFEYQKSGEIGYWIGEKYWGIGIGTQALTAMTNMIFESTDIVRLYAPVFSPNVASMRVLEKCGFSIESVQIKALYKHNTFYNAHVYAKINS